MSLRLLFGDTLAGLRFGCVAFAGRRVTEWLRIKLTEEERKIVQEGRHAHPSACVRRRLLVIWSPHCGVTRAEAARFAVVVRSTVERDVSLYRRGGLEALRSSGRDDRPTSELAQHTEIIRQSFERQPVRTMAEVCHRVKELTGLERGRTQVRTFLKSVGLKRQRVRAIPVPPKKSRGTQRRPRAIPRRTVESGPEGGSVRQGHVYFVDAAQFVFGTFLCLWSLTRLFVRATSGRERFNVLGAWNALTRELVAVTNTMAVDMETRCELMRRIVALKLTGPITPQTWQP